MGTTTEELVRRAYADTSTVTVSRLEVHQYAGTAQIIDVRESEELTEQGWIAGAMHVPRGMLEFRADPANASHIPILDPGRTTVVYCAAGQRSALAARTLVELGYVDVARLDGGIEAWKRAHRPVVGLMPWHDDLRTTTTHIHQGSTR